MKKKNVGDKKVGKFSKGMKQRLLLAQALINDPELLILDEPMTGLDPKGIAEFKDIIRRQKKEGKTVFFSSHILAHVEEVCDTVGVIVKGRLVLEDSIENIKREFLRKAGTRLSSRRTGPLTGVLLNGTPLPSARTGTGSLLQRTFARSFTITWLHRGQKS